MSRLVEHAKRELALAGNDEDFNNCIVKAVEGFTSYGHSGSSAEVGLYILTELLKFRNLTPLTDDPAEWNYVAVDIWQSSRNSEAFSSDGGKTYRLNSEDNGIVHTSKSRQVMAKYKYQRSSYPGLVTVDAVHLVEGNEKDILHFLESTGCSFELIGKLKFIIGNPDEPLIAEEGQWLILGNSKEFFTLDEAEFDSTYSPLNPETQKD